MEQQWLIRFRPNPGLLACGGNPVALLNELRALGHCEIIARTDIVPTLHAIQPDVCYLSWTISLRAACGVNAIRDVFIFVEDGSHLEVERVETEADQEESRQADNAGTAPPANSAASPETTKKQEAKAAGATAWIVKPFRPEQLLAVVQKVLG